MQVPRNVERLGNGLWSISNMFAQSETLKRRILSVFLSFIAMITTGFGSFAAADDESAASPEPEPSAASKYPGLITHVVPVVDTDPSLTSDHRAPTHSPPSPRLDQARNRSLSLLPHTHRMRCHRCRLPHLRIHHRSGSRMTTILLTDCHKSVRKRLKHLGAPAQPWRFARAL